MAKGKLNFYWLFLILVIAAILRFYDLPKADVISDEAMFAFRSIGYIDFFASPNQTTPWEWFSDNLPVWARLSFHDAPPLVFLIQHVFFVIFGENLYGLRLAFALAGVLAVFLLYLIGKELFNRQIGLIAGLLLAVSSYHVWISRIGLQESIVIFFSLLTFYLFIRSFKTDEHWPWGLVLGLALLTKYTAIVLLPIFIIYLLLFFWQVFKDKRFWLAMILMVLIFSPVLIYNVKLYQARGHFDLQLSYLLGQKVPQWQSLPGKDQIGDFSQRLQDLLPALAKGMLWPMFILFVLSVFYSFFYLKREKNLIEQPDFRSIFLLILAIIFHLLLLLLIGSSSRFAVAAVPFITLLIAWFLCQQQKILKYLLIAILAIVELFFTANTLLVYQPIGREGLTYSYLYKDSANWGYNQLNDYLESLLKNKKPGVSFIARYQFLEDIKNKALIKAKKENKKSENWLLIYDANMSDLAALWLFSRPMIYHGWPIVIADDYLAQGKDFWLKQGIKSFYFFAIVDKNILQKPAAEQTEMEIKLIDQLKEDIKPEIINRPDGRNVFKVYYWQ